MTDSYQVTPASIDIPQLNLVPNPSFEVDTVGWTGLTRNTTAPAFGTHSASCALIPSSTVADIALSDLIPIQPDTTYRLTYYALNDSGNMSYNHSLRWYQADGTTLISETTPGTQAVGGSPNPPSRAGTANQSPNYLVSPSDAAFARIHVEQQSAPFSNTPTVDGFMLTEGSSLYDYFDGDTADDTYYTYDWLGTPHNSISVRTPRP